MQRREGPQRAAEGKAEGKPHAQPSPGLELPSQAPVPCPGCTLRTTSLRTANSTGGTHRLEATQDGEGREPAAHLTSIMAPAFSQGKFLNNRFSMVCVCACVRVCMRVVGGSFLHPPENRSSKSLLQCWIAPRAPHPGRLGADRPTEALAAPTPPPPHPTQDVYGRTSILPPLQLGAELPLCPSPALPGHRTVPLESSLMPFCPENPSL